MKTVGTKLDNSKYETFEKICQECGLTKSEQLRELIDSFVSADKESKEIETVAEPKDPEPDFPIVDGKPQPIVEFVFD